MPAIKHLLQINASPANVYEAITTPKGLSSWWTTKTKADAIVGSVAEFWFADRYHDKMYVVSLDKNKQVEWECIDGDKEWIGTRVRFTLNPKDGGTELFFWHYEWKKETDFFASCNFHWGRYMKSLKDYCETGKGDPYK
jgi:uncharacterized protein YndB with AHSA1/START domain